MKRIHIFLFLFCNLLHSKRMWRSESSDSGQKRKTTPQLLGMQFYQKALLLGLTQSTFNSGDGVNMRNMLLSSQYSTIADILKHLGERTLYQELR